MKYKGVIFDLDGVICHTDNYHYEAWKTIADKLDIYFDKSINNRLRGVSRIESLEIILENYKGEMSDEDKNKLTEEKNILYKELLTQMSESDLPAEVKETLLLLKEQNIKLAIGSSSKNALYILDRLGIRDMFEAVSDGNLISKSKPDPEVFVLASKLIGLAPKDCVVVEDAVAGIQAGCSANMDTIAIGDATRCGLATYNIDSFREIARIISCS